MTTFPDTGQLWVDVDGMRSPWAVSQLPPSSSRQVVEIWYSPTSGAQSELIGGIGSSSVCSFGSVLSESGRSLVMAVSMAGGYGSSRQLVNRVPSVSSVRVMRGGWNPGSRSEGVARDQALRALAEGLNAYPQPTGHHSGHPRLGAARPAAGPPLPRLLCGRLGGTRCSGECTVKVTHRAP